MAKSREKGEKWNESCIMSTFILTLIKLLVSHKLNSLPPPPQPPPPPPPTSVVCWIFFCNLFKPILAHRQTVMTLIKLLCRLLNIFCNLFKPILAHRSTVWTLIKLLLEEQSNLGIWVHIVCKNDEQEYRWNRWMLPEHAIVGTGNIILDKERYTVYTHCTSKWSITKPVNCLRCYHTQHFCEIILKSINKSRH